MKPRDELASLLSQWARKTPLVEMYDIQDLVPHQSNYWDRDDLHLSRAGSAALGERLANEVLTWLAEGQKCMSLPGELLGSADPGGSSLAGDTPRSCTPRCVPPQARDAAPVRERRDSGPVPVLKTRTSHSGTNAVLRPRGSFPICQAPTTHHTRVSPRGSIRVAGGRCRPHDREYTRQISTADEPAPSESPGNIVSVVLQSKSSRRSELRTPRQSSDRPPLTPPATARGTLQMPKACSPKGSVRVTSVGPTVTPIRKDSVTAVNSRCGLAEGRWDSAGQMPTGTSVSRDSSVPLAVGSQKARGDCSALGTSASPFAVRRSESLISVRSTHCRDTSLPPRPEVPVKRSGSAPRDVGATVSRNSCTPAQHKPLCRDASLPPRPVAQVERDSGCAPTGASVERGRPHSLVRLAVSRDSSLPPRPGSQTARRSSSTSRQAALQNCVVATSQERILDRLASFSESRQGAKKPDTHDAPVFASRIMGLGSASTSASFSTQNWSVAPRNYSRTSSDEGFGSEGSRRSTPGRCQRVDTSLPQRG